MNNTENMQNAAMPDEKAAVRPPRKSSNGTQHGKKTAAVIIAVVMIVLVLACAVLVKLNNSGAAADAEAGKVTVVSGGEQVAVFELQDLQAMNRVDIKKYISSGSGDDEDGVFSGPELKDVLEAAGVKLTGDEKSITVKSEDGYTTAFDADEVMADDCILIVYEKDGELLKSRAEGGNGPFRIIAVDDTFGTRCAKYVNVIEVDK